MPVSDGWIQCGFGFARCTGKWRVECCGHLPGFRKENSVSGFCRAGYYRVIMTRDSELLRLYSEQKSEAAFAELVSRHVDLVHSAAKRQVNGDSHLAQDVAQMVFSELSRQAQHLSQ